MKRQPPTFLLLVLPLSIALGCTGEEPRTVCDEAADHLASCSGGTSEGFSATCGAEAQLIAERTLDASCEELGSSAGKTDEAAEASLCIALVLPLLVVHDIPEGEACCVPYNCERGLTCNTTTPVHTCRPPAPEGSDCGADWDCVGGLRCVLDECAPPVTDGGVCENGDCGSGLVCLGGTCGAPLAEGAMCEERDCGEGLVCVSGTCMAPLGEGLACEHGDCVSGLLCLDGACQTQLCDPDMALTCGIDATCWDGICEPKHVLGEPCAQMHDCEFGLFCSTEGACYDPFD